MFELQTGISAVIAYLAHESASTPLTRLKRAYGEWRARVKERTQLVGLDERMLRDIGLTKIDIWHEANKPFWRP
jgi:uncharacterized protein YjiS (DUF1127 family)